MIRIIGVMIAGLSVLTPGAVAQVAANPLERYVLDEPAAELRLPGRLREVSGLAVASDGRLFAHDDERAVIYEIDLKRGELVKGFAMGDPVVRDDFEGIAIVEDRFFLVSSDGTIYETREGADGDRLLFNRYGSGVGRECEVEGLAYEPAAEALLLACKTIRNPALAEFVAVFIWSLAEREVANAPLRIALDEVERVTGRNGFRASGIARDPETGHYLLVSARDRALLVVTSDGDVVGGSRLHRNRHPQAEGVTFGADGRLLIADEGGNGRARITAYAPREPSGQASRSAKGMSGNRKVTPRGWPRVNRSTRLEPYDGSPQTKGTDGRSGVDADLRPPGPGVRVLSDSRVSGV